MRIPQPGSTLFQRICFVITMMTFPAVVYAVSASVTFHTSTTKIPTGSVIAINQALSVEAGKSKVYMQRGQELNKVRHTYEPYCYFSLKRPRSEMSSVARIEPESLTVGKEYRRMEQMADLETTVATSISIGVSIGSGTWLARNEGGPQNLNYYMDVSSTMQPTLTHFVCGVFADPRERGVPTVEEIQKAVGDLVTITLPQ